MIRRKGEAMGMGRFWRAAATLAVWAVASLAAVSAAAAADERRVALVIGNSDYQAAGRLRNPANDAADVAAALAELGFSVSTGIDLDVEAFAGQLAAFGRALQGADVGLFYFAGHGLQFDSENYLLPVDAKLENQFSVRRETIPLDEIVNQMESLAGISIVVLDACRNNPLSENLQRSLTTIGRSAAVGRGLARIGSRGSQTMIAFAAGPDEVAEDGDGRNSPFTEALLRHIATPGIEVSTLFKRVRGDVEEATGNRQRPEQLTRMSREFYFLGQAETATAPAAPSSDAEPARDLVAFRAAQSTGTLAAWDAFLSKFANSSLAGVAQAARDKLARKVESEPSRLANLDPGQKPPPAEGPAEGNVDSGAAAGCARQANDPSDPARVGDGVAWEKIDGSAALAACRKAYDSAPGEPRLAFLLARSMERAEQTGEAAKLYREAAEKGYAAAMEAVGRFHQEGIAAKADPIEAVRWYRKAAAAGSSSAMTALGLMYARGSGVAKDDRTAVEWYRRAAEAGFPTAMNNLAFMLVQGRGTEKDMTEALRWYARAAEAGHAPAMYNLAWMYDGREGVPEDPERAGKLFMDALRASADFADSIAQHSDALSDATRRALQRELREAGFYASAIDGEFGPGTRRALAAAAGR